MPYITNPKLSFTESIKSPNFLSISSINSMSNLKICSQMLVPTTSNSNILASTKKA